MTVLPQTEALFSRSAASAPETALLLLTAQDAVPVEDVLNLLRDTNHEVVLVYDGRQAGAGASPSTYLRPNGTTVATSKSKRALESSPQLRGKYGGLWQPSSPVERPSQAHFLSRKPLEAAHIERILNSHLLFAHMQQKMVVRAACLFGICLFAIGLVAQIVDQRLAVHSSDEIRSDANGVRTFRALFYRILRTLPDYCVRRAHARLHHVRGRLRPSRGGNRGG
ncbi:hypothetical protein T492DRAFT_1140831 [Pavlovales sp. CCMP2436]|nr:hypothetical protein T492DRAFT_1140831 [Pavlovales sp. CCMP2436]